MTIQVSNEGITINGEAMQIGTAYGDISGTYFIVYKADSAQKWRVGAYGCVFDDVKSEFSRRLMATATGGYRALRPNDTPLHGLKVNTGVIEF